MKTHTDNEIRQTILEAIRRIAPETDLQSIEPDRPIRDQVDLDSLDFFRLLVSLHQTFEIEIPESDYAQFATLRSSAEYLARKLLTRATG